MKNKVVNVFCYIYVIFPQMIIMCPVYARLNQVKDIGSFKLYCLPRRAQVQIKNTCSK